FLECAAGTVALIARALVVHIGAADPAIHRAADLLHFGVRNIANDGVGNFLPDGFPAGRRAGNHFLHAAFFPNLARAGLVGLAARNAHQARVVGGLARARVEAAFLDALPAGDAAAGLAVRLFAPLAAALGDALVHRHGLANLLAAFPVASLANFAALADAD